MTEDKGEIESRSTRFATASRTNPGGVAIRLVAMLIAVVALSPAFAEDGRGDRAAGDDCARTGSETGTVAEVVDGDTLVLADGRIVRLAGVEAPKAYLARPGAEVEAVAAAARRALERLAGGKRVAIRPAEPARDRHGRIRAEVTLEDGTWLQQAMVDLGFVRVRPFAGEDWCLDALRAGEREAREARRGLWRKADFSVVSAYDPSLIDRKGLYVIVEGRVISVGHGDRVDFLNFGHVWRRDFTVLVGATAARRLAESGRSTDTMTGKRVRVRGIIEESGGPAIRLSVPGEIEVLGEE
jgi:endonuclease YncB( thermonuclease family)